MFAYLFIIGKGYFLEEIFKLREFPVVGEDIGEGGVAPILQLFSNPHYQNRWPTTIGPAPRHVKIKASHLKNIPTLPIEKGSSHPGNES